MSRTGFGIVAARARSDEWFEVRLIIDNDPSHTEALEILAAVCRAFGFILGRQVFLRGYEDSRSDCVERHLIASSQEPTHNSLLKPLSDQITYLKNVETLLGKAIDFFLTEKGRRVAQYLFLCWDTVDNTLTTSLTIVSICLEGLVGLVPHPPMENDPSYTLADLTVTKEWLANNTTILSPRFIKRLEGFLKSLCHKRPIDILYAWAAKGLLGVTNEDIEAWKLTRHPAAHADLIDSKLNDNELEVYMNRLDRIINLINRIVLHLMGYTGSYIDYSKRNWPEMELPSMDLDKFE